jgi:aryl-alcohol dehydrogenase
MPEMLAAVARAPHSPVELTTLQLDDPAANEVLVEVQAAGICHSDLAGRDQLMPFALPGVLGHEGAGIVRAIGSAVTAVEVGDRVVMSQAFCGSCKACTAGRISACPNTMGLALNGARTDGTLTITDEARTRVSGGYLGQSSWATHALVREPNVVRLPDDVPWEVASPLACGVQTGAGAIINVLKPAATDSIVVFGAGTVGLSAVMAAKFAGCETIIVADPQPARLELARELGANYTLDPTSEDAVAIVRAITGGGADFAIEASGSTAAGPLAVGSIASQGTCLLLGVVTFGTKIELDWIGLVSGQTVLGAPFGGGSPAATISALLEMRAAGGLPVEKLVRTYDFHDIQHAIADMESGVTIKPVLLFN